MPILMAVISHKLSPMNSNKFFYFLFIKNILIVFISFQQSIVLVSSIQFSFTQIKYLKVFIVRIEQFSKFFIQQDINLQIFLPLIFIDKSPYSKVKLKVLVFKLRLSKYYIIAYQFPYNKRTQSSPYLTILVQNFIESLGFSYNVQGLSIQGLKLSFIRAYYYFRVSYKAFINNVNLIA